MIGLEKARALKEAGLVWEPKKHDLSTLLDAPWLDGPVSLRSVTAESAKEWANDERIVFMPRLGQLLAGFKARGCGYSLDYVPGKGERISIWQDEDCEDVKHFAADTPEDAAADALLYLLGQEAG